MSRDFLQDICSDENNYLMHHGILGQRWGIRCFQNKDGSLTPEGRKRYLNDSGELNTEGKAKFVDMKNGKYERTDKYMTPLSIVGGPIGAAIGAGIDVARTKKLRKQAEANQKAAVLKDMQKIEQEQKEYEERMAPVWNAEYMNALANADDNVAQWQTWIAYKDGVLGPSNKTVDATINRQMGKNDVRFHAHFSPLQSEMPPEDAAMAVNDAVNRYIKEYKKVESTVSEELAKAYYDSGSFKKWDSEWSNVDRNKFKDLVVKRLGEIDLDANGEEPSNSVIWFNGIDNDYYSQFYGDDLFGNNFVSVEYDIINDIAYDPELHKGG